MLFLGAMSLIPLRQNGLAVFDSDARYLVGGSISESRGRVFDSESVSTPSFSFFGLTPFIFPVIGR